MQPVSRRRFLGSAARIGLGAVGAAAAGPFVLRGRYRVFAAPAPEYPERVVRLMRESTVVDMLNQFLYRLDQKDLEERWLTEAGAFKQTDFERFKGSGVNAISFGDGADSFADAQTLFSKWNNFIAMYPQWLMRIDSAADIARAREQGKFGILYGLQSSAQFETLDDVNKCHGLGLRVSQLSYNFRSLVADGAFEPVDAGVSEFGGKVIERMNTVRMAVDLGHASDKTKLDALEISKAPVILSHGNCRALIPEGRRATTDEAIKKLAAKGGVMGITDIAFMVKGTEPVRIDDVVDHFDHVRDLVGIEHVGVGSDAGIESNDLGDPAKLKGMLTKADKRYRVHGTHEIVQGLEGPNRMWELCAALVRRGYTDEQIGLVLGGNWVRVLKEIWGN
ncbi:dipeptidase [Occallatibacter riparius]|uniref:Dipeptidase n=1 Tax=Occallatibacter riparius TaxID=1002689 RepID=A0A9J7BYZ8_9BACT|nr:dipeptidase [Occallatibacter riparius]UWZ86726.1 dipeptidase [Occallatibacter riparius]